MTPELQTFLAAAIVILTLGLFTRRWWRNRDKKGCGGGCGCSQKIGVKPGATRL